MLRSFVLISALAIVVGCGTKSDGPKPVDAKPTFPVNGELLVDGKPAMGVIVHLIPVENVGQVTDGVIDDDYGSGHSAATDSSGKFSISTNYANDGAPAGDYVVAFRWIPAQLDANKPDARTVELFNKKYGNVSKAEVKVTVESGQPKDMGKLELTSK